MNINMSALYEMVVRNKVITRDNLRIQGYSEEEIDYLLQTKKIIIINNQYQFNDIDGLYSYGEAFVAKFNYRKAKECFRKCRELNPNHRNALFQKIVQLLRGNQIQDALGYFDIILTIEPEKYFEENNLFLYLLSILNEVPEKYSSMVDMESLCQTKEASSEEEFSENEIKEIICRNRLTLAMSLLNDLIAKNPTYNIKRVVLKQLLSKAIDNDIQIKANIYKMVEQECYHDLIQYLENIKKKRKLEAREYYILCLSKILLDLINNNIVPMIAIPFPSTLGEAIRGNNFGEAMKLNKMFLKKINKPKKEDPIFILLRRICKMINKLKLEEATLNAAQEEINICESTDLPINENVVGETMEIPSDDSRNLNDILYFMKESNMSLEDVILNYSLTFEETLILKLLMAKDCYTLGFETLGDKYLREVSEQREVSEKVAALLVDIQTNRQTIMYGVSRKRETTQ